MLSFFDPLRNLAFYSVLFRVILGIACGAIIGLERSSKNRPAGFRTHVIICLGAVAASMTGHYIYLGMKLPADVTRMGAQIITGLGFLGAGTILVTRNNKVKGLTTAAGLWTTGIIGLCIGAGFYEGGILCTALVLITELVLANIVNNIRTDSVIPLLLIFSEKDALDQMMRYCKDRNLAISRLQVNTVETEGGMLYRATISLHVPYNAHIEEILVHIHGIVGIESVELLAEKE